MSQILLSVKKKFELITNLRRKKSRRVIRLPGGGTREEFQIAQMELLQQIHQLQDRTGHLTLRQKETVAWANARSQQDSSKIHSPINVEPLVSILMPVWNRESVVDIAIESVIKQTWKNWELLIIDDGSSDQTLPIASQFTDEPRIRLFARAHQGVGGARNYGLPNAQGEYVADLDSDNGWYENHLEWIVGSLQQHPKYSCGYATQYVRDVSRKMSYLRGREFDREFFSKHGGIDLNTFVHRIDLYHQYGGFDESLTRLVDWDLISRYLQNSSPLFVSDVTNYYEESCPDSISVNEDFQSNSDIVQGKMKPAPTNADPQTVKVFPQQAQERKAS